MGLSRTVAASLLPLMLVAGCAAESAGTVPEASADTTAASTADTNANGTEEQRAGSAAASTSGVPLSVLKNYAVWSIGSGAIPADPPAGSKCSAPLDAVTYGVVGCADSSGADVPLSPSQKAGVYCSANDGAGITSLQGSCLGGWLVRIAVVNGAHIPTNVILSGNGNKVVSSETKVVLLECPTPPAGLAQHNVLYKAIYNEGIFAPKTPEGCTPYELGS